MAPVPRRRVLLSRSLLGFAAIFLLSVASNANYFASTWAESFTRFSVYLSNDRLNPGTTACDTVFAVPRAVPETRAVARAALEQLFRGPTPEEKALGYHSFFSAQTATLLRRITIHDGTAYIDLHDMRPALAGATSSCGSAEFISQVAATLAQFPAIERTVFAIEGDPKTFYEWLEFECGPMNDHCDSRRFRRAD